MKKEERIVRLQKREEEMSSGGVNRIKIIGIGLILGVVVCYGARDEKLLNKIEELKGSIRAGGYSYENEVDEEAGEFYMNCSGLVNYILADVAPEVLERIWDEPDGYGRRRAVGYWWAIFNEAEGWEKINDIQNVRAGDVIVWREEEYVATESSGHVMVILKEAEKENDGRWRIRIFDSAALSHGNDSRGRWGHGVGEGDVWLTVNERGEAIGYWWSDRQKKASRKPIVIGRLRA